MKRLCVARLGLKQAALCALAFSVTAASATAPSGLDAAGQLQALLPAPQATGFAWQRLQAGLQFQQGGITKSLVFYGPGIVRVSAHRGEVHTRQPSLVVVVAPQPVQAEVSETAETLTIAGPQLRVVVDKASGALTFQRADGTPLTRERGAPLLTPRTEPSGTPTYAIEQGFTLAADESLYGLGQYDRPVMDYRGHDVLMVQTNIGIVVPFMMSTRRWGLLWDVYAKGRFADGPQGATFAFENAPAGVDYYFVAGADMDGVIAGYRQLTGAAPMLPRSAFGLFMSKERYPTQQRLVEVARRFRAERFPLDWIVQDWQYWGGDKDGTWSGMIWNAERFPDPVGMARTLHGELNARLLVSIWPSVGNDTALARELDAKGLRFEPLHWISGKARIYDAFSDEGRAIYFKHLKKGLLDVGVDGLWMDGTEVEVGGAAHDPAQVEADIKRLGRNAMGDFERYLNVYSLLTTRGAYEGQRATSDKRVFTLTRSAWAGQQRYAALPWSGDTTASWTTLRQQIAGGLNVAMAGQPYWTQDTGGFFVTAPGGERNAAYRELFARWHQFAIFNPVYRIHGTDINREPWVFKALDPAVYGSLKRAAELRYRLLPYLYGLGWRSTNEGYTMMRGLAMDFPDQPALRKLDDTYMFGPAFLVQPITRPMFHAEPPPAPTVPAAQLRTADGRPGLSVQYFDGMNFEKPAGRTVDAQVDHRWPGPPLGNPPPGLDRLERFSARWQGELVAAETGEHEIGVEGDDGFRLWLDDKLVAEDWANGPARLRSARLTLRAGQAVRVRIDYYQDGGDRALRLAWRPPSEQRAMAARKLDPRQATLLPVGSDWYDFWTGRRHSGGGSVTRTYAIDEFPLFVRAGAVLPLGPVVQHSGEKLDAPHEVRVYPGADGGFTLYEDDGETYRYEAGERATVALAWNDARRTLSIGARAGQFPGMTRQRELRIRLMDARGGSSDRTVTYTGSPIQVRFDRTP
jgi:alpha-D-xyloside xylohydrolase